MQDVSHRLEEISVTDLEDIDTAVSLIRFHWNQKRHQGEPIVVEIWSAKEAPFEVIG